MAAAAALKFITLPAVKQHTATVIFLHVGFASLAQCALANLSTYHDRSYQGLGDKGSSELGWKQILDMFRGDHALGHIKWILPDA